MRGTRTVKPIVFVLGLVSAHACDDQPSRAAYLRHGATTVCDPDNPLLVQVTSDGRYALNDAVMDSAQLVRALRTILPPRPDRLVMVRLDSARATELRWIVPAIESGGGVAYMPDSACFPGTPRLPYSH